MGTEHGPVRQLRRRILRQLLHRPGSRYYRSGGYLRALLSTPSGGVDRRHSQAARENRETRLESTWREGNRGVAYAWNTPRNGSDFQSPFPTKSNPVISL